MPKRTDIHKVMIIGSDPIIIRTLYHHYCGSHGCRGIDAYQSDHGSVKSLQNYHRDIDNYQGGRNQ